MFKISTFSGIETNFGMELKAHLYVPKLQGRLGEVEAGEGVGQRWAEEGLGAERAEGVVMARAPSSIAGR